MPVVGFEKKSQLTSTGGRINLVMTAAKVFLCVFGVYNYTTMWELDPE